MLANKRERYRPEAGEHGGSNEVVNVRPIDARVFTANVAFDGEKSTQQTAANSRGKERGQN